MLGAAACRISLRGTIGRARADSEHIDNCGDALGKSVRYFNQFIGSLEHLVMPQARKFHELQVEGTAAAIAALEPIDIEPRTLRADGDFASADYLDDPALPAA